MPASPAALSRARLALLAFAMLIVSLDQYIVVVARPAIGRDLGCSARTLQSISADAALHRRGDGRARWRAGGLAGEPLRLATADGLRAAVPGKG